MVANRILTAASLLVALTGCREAAAPSPAPAYVRVEAARPIDYAPVTSLTGEVRARHQSDIAFRVAGRIVERLVDVGAVVSEGQPLARLDPQEQIADLDAAQASVRAAEAQLKQAQATFERQRQLIGQGFTTRREYDAAEAAYRTAQGGVEAAQAQANAAQDTRGFTTLVAGAAGIITARLAEVGQVVQAAQSVFTLAQAGDRDAIFAVQESLFLQRVGDGPVRLQLVADPAVTATGKVREVSPSVDATTGTVRVTVGIDAPPKEMALGSVVSGAVTLRGRSAFIVPWTSLSEDNGRPAIWVMQPDQTAAMKVVRLLAHETGRVIVSEGLAAGDMVITDGTKMLRPGQKVTVMAGGS